jgi:hypothetical protein
LIYPTMSIVSPHIRRNMLRRVIAAGVTALYLALVISPLASCAMHVPNFADAGGRECSGDCNLCGCSPESRTNHTCCCSMKRKQQAHAHEDDQDGTPDCCKKKLVEKKTVIACGCPCGSGKKAALTTGSSSEVLPFHFNESFAIPYSDATFSNPTHRLISRHGEPPDPPPRLPQIS